MPAAASGPALELHCSFSSSATTRSSSRAGSRAVLFQCSAAHASAAAAVPQEMVSVHLVAYRLGDAVAASAVGWSARRSPSGHHPGWLCFLMLDEMRQDRESVARGPVTAHSLELEALLLLPSRRCCLLQLQQQRGPSRHCGLLV